MRKIISVGAIVAVLALSGVLPAWMQYHWASQTMTLANANGWTLIHSSDNYIDPVQPWTIVKPPINMLVFTKPDAIRVLSKEIVAAPTLWMTNRHLVEGDDFQTWYAADCHKNEIAPVDSTTPTIESLAWNKVQNDTPGFAVLEAFCHPSA